MLRDIKSFRKIYIATGYTDLRKGIDGLSAIVKMEFDLTPFEKDDLFLFCGKKQDRFKALVWEGDGFLLMYKRIEGGRLCWPRTTREAAQLKYEDYRQLLDGCIILQKPSVREVYPTEVL